MFTPVLIIFALVPSIIAQCNLETAKRPFRRAVYEFSLDLLYRVAQEKDNHFIASTLSPWTLISCASLGAAGTTLQEIQDVLKLHPQKCFNNKYFELSKAIATVNESSEIILQKSTVMFVDDQLPLKGDFKDKVDKTGASDIEVIPLSNFDVAATIINEHVSKATHGVINDIITPDDLQDVALILVDAIYFKAPWQTPFATERTQKTPFYDEQGMQVGEVNMMFVSNDFNFGRFHIINCDVLELPYGTDGRFSMLLFLPLPETQIYTVIGSLKYISLESIFNALKSTEPTSVNVRIPRFKITSDLSNMKELLVDMGLKTMFESGEAQFPDISDSNLYISNFIQKADIEVTEQGTVAAAVTQAQFSLRTSPLVFTANRPFVYMIVDRITEIPLFTGVYSKPSVY